MTETPNIPPVQYTQAELTDDMIPAIRASVVQKRIWQSIWSLLVWGILNLLLGFNFLLLLQDEKVWDIWEDWPVLEWVVFNGGLIIALTMILLSFYGMITRHPRIILIDGCMVGLTGLWNIGVYVLVLAATGGRLYLNLFWGVLQVYWGIKEFRKHKIVVDWAKETTHISREEKKLIGAIIRMYNMGEEDFFTGRLMAKITFAKGIGHETRRLYFGKLCPEAGILVSSRMDGYLRIRRETACLAVYGKNGRVNFNTELGKRKVQFGVLSTLAWKKWAGVRITPDDLHRLLRRGKLSLEMLRIFMRDENPRIRKAVVKLLPLCHHAIGLTETVGEMLEDTDPTICAAALNICPKVKAGMLHDKVIPLLKNAANEVRHAAAKYFTSFPQGQTVGVLVSIMPEEQDIHVYRQMEKALRACKKSGPQDNSNPYTWR